MPRAPASGYRPPRAVAQQRPRFGHIDAFQTHDRYVASSCPFTEMPIAAQNAAMRVIVLINSAAGLARRKKPDERPARVEALLRQHGVDAIVQPTAPARIPLAAREALQERPDALIAAGGDGTVSAVASALVGGQIPLGVLPMGTLNHFARDAGIPLELDRAAQAIASGATRAIDVGEINGRFFINNTSIGLYPSIVRRRDRIRQRLGRSRLSAMLSATLLILRRHPMLEVNVAAPGASLQHCTPIVFVGNNEYHMDLLNLGQRDALDGGKLCVYLTHRTGRFGLFRLALRGLLGRLEQARDFESLLVEQLRIETRKQRVHVAIDGEVAILQPPLNYRIRPKSLKLLGGAPRADY